MLLIPEFFSGQSPLAQGFLDPRSSSFWNYKSELEHQSPILKPELLGLLSGSGRRFFTCLLTKKSEKMRWERRCRAGAITMWLTLDFTNSEVGLVNVHFGPKQDGCLENSEQ